MVGIPLLMPMTLRIFSDFDNTMIRESAGSAMVSFYFWHNPLHERFLPRLGRYLKCCTRHRRHQNREIYYDILRRIPASQRHRVLAAIPIFARWLETVRHIRLEHRVASLHVTIVSRNSIDLVREWVLQNMDALLQEGIIVDAIVANGSFFDDGFSVAEVRASLLHVHRVGLGQMREEDKLLFLPKNAIYVGDSDDECLRGRVKEYRRV